jgi:oligopeptide/dipeptide ABC transporter ATP-binding protein
VGESGAGKTQIMLALSGLSPPNAQISGAVYLAGRDLIGLDERSLSHIRGSQIAYVFQDPMTALNPYLTIGTQLTEVLRRHLGQDSANARRAALAALDQVQMPDAAARLRQYPHELSGGMRQRVMIAMALSCGPRLLVADEPTTALDVTVQAQILELLDGLRRETGAAVVLITHDMGVIARLADRVAVVYAGRIVETGPVQAMFDAPLHPYTAGLLRAVSRLDAPAQADLVSIPGQPPDPFDLPRGCAFAPRCAQAFATCKVDPLLRPVHGTGRSVACHLHDSRTGPA